MTESTQATLPEQLPEYTLEELITMHGRDLWTLDQDKLNRTSPYTVAQFLNRLEVDEARTVLRKLSEERAGEIIAEMDADNASEIVSEMREYRAVKILEGLDPDDAADLMGELETPDRDRLLKSLKDEDPKTARLLIELMRYPHDTAGGIMTPAITTVQADNTAQQVVETIRRLKEKVENIFYVYVVDSERHLLGVLSMRDLVLAQPEQRAETFMIKGVRGVCRPEDDREDVALEMAEYNLHALPVVDEDNRLLGIVTHDDVIDIIQREATEDVQKMAGAGADETIHDGILYSFQKRSPWLFVNLVTAILAATVVYLFSRQIEQLTILAVFMPLVASLGGNAGSQTLAVTIRSMALGDVELGEGKVICIREAVKGFLLSVVLGLTMGILGGIFTGQWLVGLALLLSMLLTMTITASAGALIPLALKKCNFDPAQSSSIFLTAISDIAGFAFFLGIGTLLLLP